MKRGKTAVAVSFEIGQRKEKRARRFQHVSGLVDVIDGINGGKFRYIERGLNRTFLTVAGAMVKELVECSNDTGKLSKHVLAEYLKPFHREKSKGFQMRQAVLRGDHVERQFGCGKCRWAPKGCGRCRAEGFKLGTKEGLTGVGIPRPGSEEANSVLIGNPGDQGGVRVNIEITSQTPICDAIFKATKGKQRGYGVIALEPIEQGEPVLEFVGELLSHEQAEAREKLYVELGIKCCYQMKTAPGLKADIIDPTLYGNAGRFINGSCSPNLCCKRIPEETNRARALCKYPRPMFYATRAIQAGEELTWRYNLPPSAETERRLSRRGRPEKVQATTSMAAMKGDAVRCYCGFLGCVGSL